MKASSEYHPSLLSGRNRRLLYEWRTLEERLANRTDIQCLVAATNADGLPVSYTVHYAIRSICGVKHFDHFGEPGITHAPIFATHFVMRIDLPPHYPCVDAPPVFRFLTTDDRGLPIPHPWHPNIRYFGEQAGRVCINMADSYTDLAWGVQRVAHYLRYECYHAVSEPPYPEDLKVASWVIRQGEPNDWLSFSDKKKKVI